MRFSLFCQWTGLLRLLPTLVMFWSTAPAAVVKPDSSSARSFAAELQRNFSAKKSAALLEMIDNRAFNERLFREPNPEENYPWAKWNGVAPALRTVEGLDSYPFLVYARVVLDRDTRTLECEFMDAQGRIQSATFFLVERDDGAIRISDFQWGGDAMPKSQMVRETVLMEGYSMPHVRPEEFAIEAMGHRNGAEFASMTRAYAQGHFGDAYAFLHALPPEVQRTRICRHYLTCLESVSKAAEDEVSKAIRNGEEFDPLERFRVAVRSSDDPAVLKSALDEVLASRQYPPVYECVKAGLLLVQGRDADAYAVAMDTVVLEPAMPLAYIIGIRASAKSRPDDALRLIRMWSRIASPSMIDEFIAAAPDLSSFRSSREYSTWQQEALPSAAQSSKG
jgi:hypothetical protein